MPETAALTELDRLEIRDLLARYAFHLDAWDGDGYLTLFTEDAIFYSFGVPHQGHAAIRPLVEARNPVPNRRHFVGQSTATGTSERANVHSYFEVIGEDEGGSCRILFLGQYHDICVKQDGRWMFQERAAEHLVDPVS